MPDYSIIACKVFEDELQRYLPQIFLQPKQVLLFDVSLHITPDKMRTTLAELISQVKQPVENILLLCGLCGNSVLGLKSEYSNLVIPRMHECLAMFLGSNEAYMKFKKESPRTYFASPGWLKSDLLPGEALYEKIKLEYLEKYQDPELVEELMDAFLEQYASYNAYLYADFLDDEQSLKQCECNAKFMKWDFASIKSSPQFFLDALNQKWDERFLILPKNATIQASFDDRIFNG